MQGRKIIDVRAKTQSILWPNKKCNIYLKKEQYLDKIH